MLDANRRISEKNKVNELYTLECYFTYYATLPITHTAPHFTTHHPPHSTIHYSHRVTLHHTLPGNIYHTLQSSSFHNHLLTKNIQPSITTHHHSPLSTTPLHPTSAMYYIQPSPTLWAIGTLYNLKRASCSCDRARLCRYTAMCGINITEVGDETPLRLLTPQEVY